MSQEKCPFCDIAMGINTKPIVRVYPRAVVLTPLNPVNPGHVLVIPKVHVPDASYAPEVTAETMKCAAQFAWSVGPYNLITSAGREATQSVFHLHIHIVPRHLGDGLLLPWSNQKPVAD